jgi:hypothetical protein
VTASSSETGPSGSVARKDDGRITVAGLPETPWTPTIVGASPFTARETVRSSPGTRFVTVSCLTSVQSP